MNLARNEAVRRSTGLVAIALASAAALLGTIGCEPPPAPKTKPMVQGFMLPPSRVAAIAELVPLDAKLNNDISGFPGVTGADHRKTLVMALDDLTKMLKLINGPDQSPGFTDALAIITAAQDTASNQSIPRDRMVAVENEALRATDNALSELATKLALDKDQLPGLLDTLTTKVTNATGTLGTMHDLDATDCFQAVAAVAHQMTNDLKAMVPEEVAPAPAPETPVQAPTPPATAPAPTSAPAPMPAPMPAP
jgi:hypothetical protein